MDQNQQIWLNERRKSAYALLKASGKRSSQNKVYELRQDLKKIMAVYAWKKTRHDAEFEEAFPALQKLFKLAGKIRNADIVTKKVSTLPVAIHNGRVLGPLKKLDKKQNIKWKHFASDKAFAKSVDKELDLWFEFCNTHRTRPAKDRSAQLNGLPCEKRNWHEYRKKIKRWIYGKEAHVAATNALSPAKMLALSKLQQVIGDWHDWQDVLTMVEKLKKQLKAADYYLVKQQAEEAGRNCEVIVSESSKHHALA
jgi:CHAD domain-containing protein